MLHLVMCAVLLGCTLVLGGLLAGGYAFGATRLRRAGERIMSLQHELYTCTTELDQLGRRMHAFHDGAADAIVVVNPAGLLVYANAAADRFFGGEAADAVGTDVVALVHADDLPRVRDYLHSAFVGADASSIEFRLDSEDRYIEALAGGLLDDGELSGLVVHLRDCTDRRAAQRDAMRADLAIQEAGRRFRAVFDNSILGMAVIDTDGRYQEVNQAYCDLLGYDRESLLHLDVSAVADPAERAAVALHFGRIAGGHVATYDRQKRYRRADGSELVADVTVTTICDQNGRPKCFVSFVRDVTEQLRTAEALAAALDLERRAASRMRELDEVRSQLLAAVTHDFRAPLTSIVGFANLLHERWDTYGDEQRQQFATRILANAGELDRRVTDFLEISRMETGEVTLDLRPLDVSESVELATGRCRFLLEHHDVELDLDGGTEAIGDRRAIARIVENLLSNAAKYSPAGTTVTVRSYRAGSHVRLLVEDEGPGIAPEDAERIFAPYERLGLDNRQGAPAGTGVGLDSVRKLVDLHGGRVWVEANQPRGARFVVELPAAGATDEPRLDRPPLQIAS
jgi:PAS domain S-box-containing protein